MDQTDKNQQSQQPIARLVLENSVPCFINEGGNLILVLPNGDKINPLFTDKIYWMKRVAYALGISPSKVEKLIEKQREGSVKQTRKVVAKSKAKERESQTKEVEQQPQLQQRVDIFQKLEEV